ncbi:MAG: hypothetical protein MUE85_14240 [Microscillaceae bacterium]|jgi:hypothetical protein|nr:hypothetical protein [Microscillaceae bacterium]
MSPFTNKDVILFLEEITMYEGGEDTLTFLWITIENRKLTFQFDQVAEAFLTIIVFLLENKIACLYGFYDKVNNKEVKWENDTQEVVSLLRKFIFDNKKKLKKDPFQLFGFRYSFVIWNVSSPIDWSKYDLKE